MPEFPNLQYGREDNKSNEYKPMPASWLELSPGAPSFPPSSPVLAGSTGPLWTKGYWTAAARYMTDTTAQEFLPCNGSTRQTLCWLCWSKTVWAATTNAQLDLDCIIDIPPGMPDLSNLVNGSSSLQDSLHPGLTSCEVANMLFVACFSNGCNMNMQFSIPKYGRTESMKH